jgi:hypothetical protein
MALDQPGPPRIATWAAAWLGNLVVLMAVALTLAGYYDDAVSSGTPVWDGALIAVVVALSLALANGAGLCLSPRTRRIGVGVVLGVVLSIPVGFLIVLAFVVRILD